jgi:hypothetical protein
MITAAAAKQLHYKPLTAAENRDRVSRLQQKEFHSELAKLLPDCRYPKPLYNTVTPIRAREYWGGNYEPPPLARIAEEPHVNTYTAEQVNSRVIHFALHPKRGKKTARLADRPKNPYSARRHADVLHTLELLRDTPAPPRATPGALLAGGDPLGEMADWLKELEPHPAVIPDGMLATLCHPASAIANRSKDKPTRIEVHAKCLQYDYRKPIPMSRWIASGETRSWLTLSALTADRDEDRWCGLGKTYMDPESEDVTDGMKDETANFDELVIAPVGVTSDYQKPRRRELERRIGMRGQKRQLKEVGFRYMRGMTQAEIAFDLQIDLSTVRHCIAWIHSKLGWNCFYRGVSAPSENLAIGNSQGDNRLGVLLRNAFEIRSLYTRGQMISQPMNEVKGNNFPLRGHFMEQVRLLTREEVLRFLRVSTLPADLPVVKVGRLIRVKQTDLEAFVARNKVTQ